ncbi:MAG: hypothetical protein SFW67_36105 [Myxococcaceae bacterium]|nr:hypothetical protein [Myxococcaceae bacterium]
MRAIAVILALTVTACDPEREAEEYQRAVADAIWAELVELQDNRAERELEQAAVRASLAPYEAFPEDEREVVRTLAATAVIERRERLTFFVRLALSAPVDPRACLDGARRLSQLGPRGLVESVEARGTCTVVLAVLSRWKRKPADTSAAPGPRSVCGSAVKKEAARTLEDVPTPRVDGRHDRDGQRAGVASGAPGPGRRGQAPVCRRRRLGVGRVVGYERRRRPAAPEEHHATSPMRTATR